MQRFCAGFVHPPKIYPKQAEFFQILLLYNVFQNYLNILI
ncbi:hypothetical protein D1AOALGA4SA_9833 [Olavius algarvensis Delta 1 endosymbiont]|nr:hypothetical protein D1AOALGA4SA_9833 [Olavius algarvensis Delta 1 endosymbiont]